MYWKVANCFSLARLTQVQNFNRNFLLFESIWWSSILFVASDRMTKHMDDSEKRNKMWIVNMIHTILVCEILRSFERASPSNLRTQGSFIRVNSRKISELDLLLSDSIAKSATQNLGFSETDLISRVWVSAGHFWCVHVVWFSEPSKNDSYIMNCVNTDIYMDVENRLFSSVLIDQTKYQHHTKLRVL